MYAIETKALTKKYSPPRGIKAALMKSPLKKEITAVDHVDLKVAQGEVFGLIGPNGAGKTTLIKMLTTLLLPTSGTAFINGRDVVRQEDDVKRSIGLVTGEERSFYWRLTGRQNLEFFAVLYGLKPDESGPRIKTLLAQLSLTDAADNMFYSYSSGMKQKLALVRGLLCNPAVLFLDEPTKSVDVLTARDLRAFIRETLIGRDNRTVFLTTHRLEEAESLCDRLAIITHGRVAFCGTVSELRRATSLKDKFVLTISGMTADQAALVCNHPSLAALTVTQSDGAEAELTIGLTVANGHNPLPHVIEKILAGGGSLLSCTKQEARLEEIFTTFLEEQQDVVA